MKLIFFKDFLSLNCNPLHHYPLIYLTIFINEFKFSS